MLLLAFVFAAAWFVTGSMAAHLPRLLELAGATPFTAIAAAALVGPAQVTARICEFVIPRRIHPLVSARLATTLHPIGAAALGFIGAAGAVPFAVFYGAGNGLLTIARGTVPLAIFGPHAWGTHRLDWCTGACRASSCSGDIRLAARRNGIGSGGYFRWPLPCGPDGTALLAGFES
jgi:hypothetical protein